MSRGRFEKRIQIPLPDDTSRCQILDIKLKGVLHTLTEDDLKEIVQTTEGYSGSDLANLVKAANMLPIDRAMDATHFKEVQNLDAVKFNP